MLNKTKNKKNTNSSLFLSFFDFLLSPFVLDLKFLLSSDYTWGEKEKVFLSLPATIKKPSFASQRKRKTSIFFSFSLSVQKKTKSLPRPFLSFQFFPPSVFNKGKRSAKNEENRLEIIGARNQNLGADLAGRDDQVGADGEQHGDEARPRDEALGAELVRVARLGPGVRGVDRGVAVDVGLELESSQRSEKE